MIVSELFCAKVIDLGWNLYNLSENPFNALTKSHLFIGTMITVLIDLVKGIEIIIFTAFKHLLHVLQIGYRSNFIRTCRRKQINRQNMGLCIQGTFALMASWPSDHQILGLAAINYGREYSCKLCIETW